MAKKENGIRVIRETRVNTPKSLLTVARGSTVEIACNDFVHYPTVQSAVSRLNQRLGRVEFTTHTPDNGATIIIHRSE